MKHLLLSCLLLAALLGLSQCKKNDPAPAPTPSQLELLPPATQTGQRTFGCLVNGKAWTESGNPLSGLVLTTQYSNQNLLISCPRAVNDSQGVSQVDQAIVFNVDSVLTTGIYTVAGQHGRELGFSDYLTRCTWTGSLAYPATLTITKLDLVNRIVAGTFAFTLETPACGKLTVTDGRFDSRF